MAGSSTPVLDQFLNSIAELVKNRDGTQLQDFLQIEPPLSEIYQKMVQELRRHYPSGPEADAELLRRCEFLVMRAKEERSWITFPSFMKTYFTFLRDVNVENLLETYNALNGLLNQCVIALGDTQFGVILLPTVLYLSKVLAKLAMGLDRRPELIAHLLRMEGGADREENEKVTLVERSANVVREAFIKCLTDRTGTPGQNGTPEGKRVGIYLMANLCLKLLFQCGKLRNAEQMFASISSQSPPLKHFPASQRVTFLQYLGRYLFCNNLFYLAQIALQAAYDECHRQAIKQKRVILSYLIPCNIIMGRFPSMQLLQRPECEGLADRFIPICRLIARGDYIAFREHLAVDSPDTEWLARKGILLALRNRCEILVWRSLARKVFIHGGFHGDQNNQGQRGPPPFLYLHKLEAAVRWLQSQHAQSSLEDVDQPGDSEAGSNTCGSQLIYLLPDYDFCDMGGLEADDPDGILRFEYVDYLAPPAFFDEFGYLQENPAGGVLGDLDAEYDAFELDPYSDRGESEFRETESNRKPTPMMREIESILASLLTQGLMRGYLTHRNPRFAIPGARHRGALPTGFPNVWQTIYARESDDDTVPGWVKPSANPFAGGGGVVRFSGARPVGPGT